MQCTEESQGQGEEPVYPPPRLLTGSEMKLLLQWEESEAHPIPTLEKQITVRTIYAHVSYKAGVEAGVVFASLFSVFL